MKKVKQIFALIAVVLLLSMYALTMIFALSKNELAEALFRASLGSTIIVPVFLYIFILWAKRSRPVKSTVIDGIIFADDHVLQEKDGQPTYFAKEIQNALWRKGYTICHFSENKMTLGEYLNAKENEHFPKEKMLFVDTDAANVQLAREAGYPALVFTDYPSLIEALESMQVKL